MQAVRYGVRVDVADVGNLEAAIVESFAHVTAQRFVA